MVRKIITNPRSKFYFDGSADTPREVHILRDILGRHDRIVRFLHHHESPGRLNLFYEYYPGGDLQGFIERYYMMKQMIPEGFIWHVYLQCLEALAFLQ